MNNMHEALEPKAQAKKCPSCSSVFLTDTVCEQCGFYLKLDRLDGPFSKKSFYTIRANYNDENFKNKWNIFQFISERKNVRSYQRKILLRFNVLLDFFSDKYPDKEQDWYHLFFQEAADLMQEYLECGGKERDLWERLDLISRHPNYQKMSRLLLRLTEDRHSQSFFEKKAFGVIPMKRLIFYTLSLFLVVTGFYTLSWFHLYH